MVVPPIGKILPFRDFKCFDVAIFIWTFWYGDSLDLPWFIKLWDTRVPAVDGAAGACVSPVKSLYFYDMASWFTSEQPL